MQPYTSIFNLLHSTTLLHGNWYSTVNIYTFQVNQATNKAFYLCNRIFGKLVRQTVESNLLYESKSSSKYMQTKWTLSMMPHKENNINMGSGRCLAGANSNTSMRHSWAYWPQNATVTALHYPAAVVSNESDNHETLVKKNSMNSKSSTKCHAWNSNKHPPGHKTFFHKIIVILLILKRI